VHLAFRDQVREEFGLSFEPWSWRLTKAKPTELADFANNLSQRGIKTPSAPVPQELQQRAQYLNSRAPKRNLLALYAPILEEMGERFRSYQSHTAEEVTRQRVEAWLLQFETEDIPFALRVLEHLRYWDRAAMMDAFSAAFEDLGSELLEAQWVPLGGSTTSSTHLQYLWPDLAKVGGCPKNILGSAEQLKDGRPIVFYDDNVCSATQSRTVFQQWLGMPRKEWIVDENHVDALTEDKVRILKTARIQFLFATGRRKGLRTLVESVTQWLENPAISGHIVMVEDMSCFRPAVGIFGDEPSAARARAAFQSAGRKALSDKRDGWGEPKVDGRLLGYGNEGGLNIFYYNVPTSTLTALWKSCREPSSWMGLFPRRGRI
jgi:hypothetical protein